ncbi:hypothetical protein OS493_009634 [Desmophyllum pertusum]|uniref:Uncharacterized protein n=1 Tax=Desmophyllum pertusum TaxID=174260 RepID=A0A9W9YSF4_9CNID|nr:hypothetical protein OS493_009634 [Desmophyllum pertusum]
MTNCTVQVRPWGVFFFLDCDRAPRGLNSLTRSSRIELAEGLSLVPLVDATLGPLFEDPWPAALPSSYSYSLHITLSLTRSPIASIPSILISSSVMERIVDGTIRSLRNLLTSDGSPSFSKMSSIVLAWGKRELHSGIFFTLPQTSSGFLRKTEVW